MRTFVIAGHTATIDPDLPLDDLPGSGGRFDVICRCVNAAFVLSHAIREDVRCFLVLQDRVTIRIEGAELRYLSPDERTIASLLAKALEAAERTVGQQEIESTPGIHASNRDLEAVLEGLSGTIVHLHEEGRPLPEFDVPASPAFVLSDHADFTAEELELVGDIADARVSVGPNRLHADHAITVAQNYLDTEGFAVY